MSPRWRLRLLLAMVLTSALAIGWISVPLLLSSEKIETKFRKFANKHGYELTFSEPPKVVMGLLPEVHLGAITLTRPEGMPVLESQDARLRPSPWMLLPGDIAAAYFIAATVVLILIFGAVNRRLNRHLAPTQRARLRLRPQFIR